MYSINKSETHFFNAGVITRITALWAFSEAFMGGILHGFKIPFAGLLLSLIAAICMSIVAVYNKKRGTILKITMAVLAVKFILSPHTPPMAYVAVLMQGLAGELFFFTRKANRVAAFFLTMFCLLYSAFQHLFILTLVFGKDFWPALDVFLNGITKTFIKKSQHYSLYLVLLYISCYFIAGVLGGVLNWRIITTIQSGVMPEVMQNIELKQSSNSSDTKIDNKKRRTTYKLLYIILFILTTMLVLSYTPLLSKTFFNSKIGQILLRGTLIMVVWNFVLSPLLAKLINRWLVKYRKNNNGLLQQLLSLFPDMKKLVLISWQLAKSKSKLARVPTFLTNTMYLTIYGK